MSLTSSVFLLFAFVAVVLLRLAPSGASRRAVIFGLNTVFLLSLAPSSIQLAPLVGFAMLGYGAILIVAQDKPVPRTLGFLVTGLTAIFIWIKQFSIVSGVPTLNFAYTVVGLSYILFRIIHILVDVGQSALRLPRLVSYLNYVFFFLSLLSGPIHRYEDFVQQVEIGRPCINWHEVDSAAGRVVLGYLMVIVLGGAAAYFSGIAKPLFLDALAHGAIAHGIWLFALLTPIYLFNLFVNFSGYMHIVVGIGRLAGITLPENFDHPFASKNFIDIWARWHITLSNWFRFYLFNPLLKALSARWGTKYSMPYLGAIAFFVTFVVMGVWHGTTSIFFVYGLFLGAGVTINRLWQIWAPKLLGKNEYKSLCARPWHFQFSRSAALGYLAVALTSFWIDDEHARQLLRPKGLVIFFGAYVLVTLAGAVIGWLADSAVARARALLTPGNFVSQIDPGPSYSCVGGIRIVALPFFVLVLATCGGLIAALVATRALMGSSLTYAVMSVAICSTILVWTSVAMGILDSAVSRFVSSSLGASRHADAMAVWFGAKAFLAVNLILLANAAPEFIYKAF